MRVHLLSCLLGLLCVGCGADEEKQRSAPATATRESSKSDPYAPHPSSAIAKRGGEYFTVVVVRQMISTFWWENNRVPRPDEITSKIKAYVEKIEMRPMLESYKWYAQESGEVTLVTIEEWRDGKKFQAVTKRFPPGDPKAYWDVQYEVNAETGEQELIKDPLNVAHCLAMQLYLLYLEGKMPKTFSEMTFKDRSVYKDLLGSEAHRFRFKWAPPKALWVELPAGGRFVRYPLTGRFEPADAEFPVKVQFGAR